MNKLIKILVAILGASDVIINLLTPLTVALLFVEISGLDSLGTYILYGLAIGATAFRAIKFWIKG